MLLINASIARSLCVLLLLFAGHALSARQNHFYSDAALDELRLELSDVKHDLHGARIEINLLEEKIVKQERTITLSKNQDEKKNAAFQLDALEKKISQLEKILDKAIADLRNFNANAAKSASKMQELELAIESQNKKFEEIVKLKGMLTSISKAIGQNAKTSPSSTTKIYNVKAGDSLEKIARTHNTTVEAIKQCNRLSHDKIVIGQEIKLFDDENK